MRMALDVHQGGNSFSRRNFLLTTLGGLAALTFPHPKPVKQESPELKLKNTLSSIRAGAIELMLKARFPNGMYADEVAVSNHSDIQSSKLDQKASIAATGYGLTNLVLAVHEGYLTKAEAAKQFEQTIKFVDLITRPEQRGWLYHFNDPISGGSYKNSEISSIDTVLFYANALVAAEFFGGEIKDRVHQMFNKVDFKFMLTNNGEHPNKTTFSHGFRLSSSGQPEFIKWDWDRDSEGMMVAMFALAQDKPSVSNDVWYKGFDRTTRLDHPLFVYFYPLGFCDFNSTSDQQGMNLVQRARDAISFQEEFCEQKGLGKTFGISACQGPRGYCAYAPNDLLAKESETVLSLPAIVSMLPIEPKKASKALIQYDRPEFKNKYGVVCSHTADSNWMSDRMHVIDYGSMLLMLDQIQSRQIIKCSQSSIPMQNMMTRLGFSVTLAKN